MDRHITIASQKWNLNPAEVDVIDHTIDNFSQLMSAKENLDELDISWEDYYRALPYQKIKI